MLHILKAEVFIRGRGGGRGKGKGGKGTPLSEFSGSAPETRLIGQSMEAENCEVQQ